MLLMYGNDVKSVLCLHISVRDISQFRVNELWWFYRRCSVNVDYLLYSLIKINSPLSIFTVYLVFSSRAANHIVWFSHCLQRYDHVSKHGNYLRCDERPLSITEWWHKSWNQTKPEALIMCFWRDLISRKIKKRNLKKTKRHKYFVIS